LKNAPQTGEERPFPESRYLRKNNSFIHFRSFKPEIVKHKIIMLNGFAGSTFCFRNNIKALTNENTLVLTCDLPPYGFSTKSTGSDLSDTTTLTILHQIIINTDKEMSSDTKWIVAGHSLGAQYAAKLVSRYPALFEKQIFIDGFFTDMQETGFSTFLKYPPLLRWADVALEYYFLDKEKFSDLLEGAYLRHPTDEEIEGYMKPFMFKNSASSIFHWACTNSTFEVDKLTIYSKPTLILWGNPDPWVPFSNKNIDTSAFKNLTFKFIEDGGHNPQETQPEKVNNYLNEFIKK
jgi:pimeloyl-ACP methyl ester carboxylesterase